MELTTTIVVLLFMYMLLVHYIGDFLAQSHDMATKKSTDNEYLIKHTAMYTLIWFIANLAAAYITLAFISIDRAVIIKLLFLFPAITFIMHTATDYITSREVKKLFDKEDYHNGFVVIGLDQILHYLQLIATFYLCII